MKKTFWLVITLGLALVVWMFWPKQAKAPLPSTHVEASIQSQKQNDNRIALLNNFFAEHNCPKPYYSDDYITSADKYNIPFTLLPAISVQESQCGRHQRLNNLWGWDSARTGFLSVPIGIDFVAKQLSTSRYYKDKTLKQKLKAYNSINPSYYSEITGLINEISH